MAAHIQHERYVNVGDDLSWRGNELSLEAVAWQGTGRTSCPRSVDQYFNPASPPCVTVQAAELWSHQNTAMHYASNGYLVLCCKEPAPKP